MPSGITHMLLAKTFNENSSHGNLDLEMLLDEKLKIFQLGALGPDLAYSQQLPHRDFFSDEDENADLFHYEKTNEIPLNAFKNIKNITDKKDKADKFAFFMGYTSHLVADGIIHPFVRDKVGDYKDAAGPHRALEMRLDAIFLDHLSTKSGSSIDINFAELHDQIKDVKKDELASIALLFSQLLKMVYNRDIKPERIQDWVDDLHDLFEIAANKNNCYYAIFPKMSSYLYNDTKKILANKDRDLWLRNADVKGRSQSFLKRDVHFLNDCIPQFYSVFKNLALKIHSWVYENGPEVTDDLVPPINLDVGRIVTANYIPSDLDKPVIFWRT